MTGPRTILFFQYGNFAEAWEQLAAGGLETYRDQRMSVDYVENLPENSVIVSLSCDHECRQLTKRMSAIGIPVEALTKQRIAQLFNTHAPDLVVLRTPHVGILEVAKRYAIPVLPCFADIFRGGGVRRRWSNWRLRRLLAADSIICVANHNLNASRSVATVLGVPKNRIVPWDWSRIPSNPVPKEVPSVEPRAFFAGGLTEDKGVGDCLQAVALLKSRGQRFHFSFAGSGQLDHFKKIVDDLGIADQVTWLGTIANVEVREAMRAHDLVVVPSRHGYNEGLPNTIYEGLASRSPLIVSDHPAFTGRIPQEACLIFRAADAEDLAAKLDAAVNEPGLYAKLSSNSETAVDQLYLGLEWDALMSIWLDDPNDRTGWVSKHSLVALGH